MNKLPSVIIKRGQLFTFTFEVEDEQGADISDLTEFMVASVSPAFKSAPNQVSSLQNNRLDTLEFEGTKYLVVTIDTSIMDDSFYQMDLRVEQENGSYHILTLPIQIEGEN